jgi:hypothetical protein
MFVSENKDGRDKFKIYGHNIIRDKAKAICLRKACGFPYKDNKSFQREN